MVKSIRLVVLFISICFPFISNGQTPKDSTKKYSDYRFTELEATFLGVGINRIFEKKKYTIGWALNFRYVNWGLISNDSLFNRRSGYDSKMDFDIIKLKFLYRKEFLNYFIAEVSPLFSASITSNEDYLLSFGVEPVLYYLKIGRVKFSASLTFKKPLNNKYYYLTFSPIRINIRLDKKENFRHKKMN
ncbi:MAG: hypothetical protein R2750_09155 [Bacteroidales bacterium]